MDLGIAAVGKEMRDNGKIQQLSKGPNFQKWNEYLKPYLDQGATWYFDCLSAKKHHNKPILKVVRDEVWSSCVDGQRALVVIPWAFCFFCDFHRTSLSRQFSGSEHLMYPRLSQEPGTVVCGRNVRVSSFARSFRVILSCGVSSANSF